MTRYYIDSLYCDGYHFFIRGWVLHTGVPSWKFSKKITLFSNTNTIQIIPDIDLRTDVSQVFNDPSTSSYINYDHSGFVLKILKQNLPSDYFKVKIEIKSDDFSDSVILSQMIYI